MWVNGEPVTIDTSNTSYSQGFPVNEYRIGSNRNHMWVRFYDGTQTTADSFLVNEVSNSARPYQSTRVGRGVAYAVVTSQVNDELFTSLPQFKFTVQGARLYDPSRDTTVGGTGTQRWNDPATWGGDGDDLPAVQIYNLLRGFSYSGTWLYGLQSTSAARLPATEWIAQINKCRLVVDGPGQGPQYMTGGELLVSTELGTATEALLTGCQGRLAEIGGLYKLHVGEPGASVFSFSDGDIISTEEQSFSPFFGLADTINGISATYVEPAEAWNVKAAPSLYRPDYEAEDGNRRLMADVKMDMVYRSQQVQRLMKSALLEARRARRHTLVLPPSAWQLEPGDVIDWTSPRNGYVTKLFRVDGVTDKANLDVMVDITEIDPSDYDWNPATDYTPPTFGPTGPMRPPPQVLTGFGAFPHIVYDDNGIPRRPAILLTWPWDAEEDVDIIGVEFEIRRQSTQVVEYRDRTDEPTAGQVILAPFSLVQVTTYEVRARFIPRSARPMAWSGWIPVTTDDVKLAPNLDFDPYQGLVGFDQLEQDLAKYQDFMGGSVRELIRQVQNLNQWVTDQGWGNEYQFGEIRKQLTATFNNARAEWKLDVNVVAAQNFALSQRVEQLDAEVFDPVTGLPAVAGAVDILRVEVNGLDGEIEAVSQSLSQLTTEVNGIASSVTIRGEAGSSPGGGWSRYGVQVKTGSGSTWSSAAFYLDTNGSLSRAVFEADQFIVVAGGNLNNPFVIDGTAVRMNVANIGTVTAGLIRGASNNLQVQLNNDRILIIDGT
ncbi:phage tail protein [Aquamicrobium sp. LC103]|nr:phage tail protein [Aquamicrobium sp. LC103]